MNESDIAAKLKESHSSLKNSPNLDAALKVREVLGPENCAVCTGSITIDRLFAEQLPAHVLSKLDDPGKLESYMLNNYYWVETRINGKLYVIDTHLQSILEVHDGNLVPHGLNRLIKSNGEAKFQHFRRYGYKVC